MKIFIQECQQQGYRLGFMLAGIVTSLLVTMGDVSWLQPWQLNQIIDEYWHVIFVLALLIGLPHGASDPLISYRSIWHNGIDLLRFLSFYLAFAVLVVIIWWYWPALCFLAFWGYSAWHFGHDWSTYAVSQTTTEPIRHKNYPTATKNKINWSVELIVDKLTAISRFLLGISERIGFGLALLALCLLFTDATVIQSLAKITELSSTTLQTLSYAIVLIPFLLIALILRHPFHKALYFIIEWIVLVITAWLCGGIVAFALYFIGLHSVEHFREFWSNIKQLAITKRTGIILFISILAVGLIIGIYGIRLLLTDWLPSFDLYLGLEVAIVGIAALSLPHIILIDWLRKNE